VANALHSYRVQVDQLFIGIFLPDGQFRFFFNPKILKIAIYYVDLFKKIYGSLPRLQKLKFIFAFVAIFFLGDGRLSAQVFYIFFPKLAGRFPSWNFHRKTEFFYCFYFAIEIFFFHFFVLNSYKTNCN